MRRCSTHLALCLGGGLSLFLLLGAAGAGSVPVAPAATDASPAAMAEYHRQLEIYMAARRRYESEADAYWTLIAEKRKIRAAKRHSNKELAVDDYVLAQPPVYSGPPRPVDPSAPPVERPPRAYVPVVADFLQSAARHFNFEPELPQSEIAYKSAYAAVASAAGLTPQQAVRVYGFESGGNGDFDVQAGLEYPHPGAHAISTALGYNQLLATNTVELLAEKGDQFLRTLSAKAVALDGDARDKLAHKLAVVRAMVQFSRSVPDDWKLHDELANTPKGLGVHALNLDIDVGPLLQTQKLKDSIVFARAKGYEANLTAAELEMMNLTGDGNGFDMVTMPLAWRERVPTANFFQPGGYERNPVAIRNNVVAKLIAATDARMDEEAKLPGARQLAALFAAGSATSASR
ncbi:MAG TPA: hypothetical protein VKW08_14145 [Xanthobacteraceae bacterium]|nr:hypothetical protein [Xanthobacteraceae bacterium]